jgi:hypothetical protein
MIESVRIEQVMRFWLRGSWLGRDRQGGGLDLESHLQVRSAEPPERIREYVRGAERACFTIQSLHPDIAVRTTVSLNGTSLDID